MPPWEDFPTTWRIWWQARTACRIRHLKSIELKKTSTGSCGMWRTCKMAVETITNLTIKGYKSIRNLENLELRRFNVLIGANGSGKSNFIDFFRMLNFMFNSTDGNLQQFVVRKGRASSILYYGAKISRYLDASVQFDGLQP